MRVESERIQDVKGKIFLKWFERIMKPVITVFRRIWIELANTVI
jgi:hypothetical protein